MTFDTESPPSVLSIFEPRSLMKHAALSQIEAYWEGLRKGRNVPLRSEIDPRGIDRSLEYAFIVERIAPSVARFRLAGMHLNDLMGMEVRGMPVTAFFGPEMRGQVTDALEHVFEGPAKAHMELKSQGSFGRPALSGALVLLPLKSDLGDISRAVGCLVSDGKPGRTPRRFEIESLKIEALTGDDIGFKSAPQSLRDVPLSAGMAEPASSYEVSSREDTENDVAPTDQEQPVAPSPSERPYLRLIRSND